MPARKAPSTLTNSICDRCEEVTQHSRGQCIACAKIDQDYPFIEDDSVYHRTEDDALKGLPFWHPLPQYSVNVTRCIDPAEDFPTYFANGNRRVAYR